MRLESFSNLRPRRCASVPATKCWAAPVSTMARVALPLILRSTYISPLVGAFLASAACFLTAFSSVKPPCRFLLFVLSWLRSRGLQGVQRPLLWAIALCGPPQRKHWTVLAPELDATDPRDWEELVLALCFLSPPLLALLGLAGFPLVLVMVPSSLMRPLRHSRSSVLPLPVPMPSPGPAVFGARLGPKALDPRESRTTCPSRTCLGCLASRPRTASHIPAPCPYVSTALACVGPCIQHSMEEILSSFLKKQIEKLDLCPMDHT